MEEDLRIEISMVKPVIPVLMPSEWLLNGGIII